jgi:chemotaxis protein methyltransferase CheR
MRPNEAAWAGFYSGLLRVSGIDLKHYKADQMHRRVAAMADAKGFENLREFSAWIEGSAENTQWFLDKMAINVSELFRNIEKWRELESVVLPELLNGRPGLQCWSAGCSYGAEAHSLAAILAARFPGRHRILGTDIDRAALDQARKGEFADADMKHAPKPYLESYFEKTPGGWRANQAIRGYCRFERGNLLEDPPKGEFDLILCRNVVIYFTDAAKSALYAKFVSALRPGGILFVGSTERIFNARELGFECPLPFFYRKAVEGGQQWRNAS